MLFRENPTQTGLTFDTLLLQETRINRFCLVKILKAAQRFRIVHVLHASTDEVGLVYADAVKAKLALLEKYV